MTSEAPERFVDADEAGKFLSLTRRRVLDLARAGHLPGHPIGDGARRVWRFRLSELAAGITSPQKPGLAANGRIRTFLPQANSGRVRN
jgi:hypothetical protein